MVDPNRDVNLAFNFFNAEFNSNDGLSDRRSSFGAEPEEDDDEDEGLVYCICRTSDTSRFMIGCDKCNEWYHGDCISITEEYAKRIQQFYCLMCRDKDPSLEIKFKEKKQYVRKDKSGEKQKSAPQSLSNSAKVGVDILIDDKCKIDPDYEPELKRRKYLESEDEDEEDEDDDDEDEFVPKPPSKKTSAIKRSTAKVRNTQTKTKTKRPRKKDGPKVKDATNKGGRRKNKLDDSTKVKKSHKKELIEVDEGPKQCYGPGCIKVARKGSKYCSDDCGMKLATNRIYEILPHRIRQWQSTSSAADKYCQKSLELIRQEQQTAKRILEELDLKQQLLDELISKAQTIPPLSEEETNEETETESELSIYCVTCGHEVSYRLAMRHMERCFNKYESQTSFGSAFRTKIEGVFCDVYNPHQKTYCKRLKILCPEHSKDPKIGDDEVCGCPLVTNCFDYTGNFCRELKKKCSKHFCWAKLRRAELDMERLQQWFKLDELFEKEQKIRYTMANRGGVLALMLHQTIIQE
ncbi:PHD finger and CXXC domain-containing protein-like protein [Dinothrombium tinctorium]|uniref:CXXC-type zinc finger protein 1 n=1 Tax=Dinothrombium tinctorium TaxID=1965070 RepID=A0A3S4R368_9ACAR|nr:PHD finger and CXXC domain-containing protein-like protein [Dinothrombium tinctorium]